MSFLPGLASAHDSIEGLVYFPRMLSKIRLHAAGKLPAAYHSYLGDAPAHGGHGFDARCCRFLGVSYQALARRTLEHPGTNDAAVLAWARTAGRNPSPERIEIWSGYAAKRGWRDDATPSMREWARELGADPDTVLTWFDGFDIDEGRKRPADYTPEPLNPGPFPQAQPTLIPGLPSPHETVGGLVHFPRMVAKIALHAAGKLPEGWVPSLGWGKKVRAGISFDSYCLRFLGIDYEALQTEVLTGNNDPAALLAWAYEVGTKPTEEEITVWNAYMRKRCWRDRHQERLVLRLQEAGLPGDAARTMFDFIDLDEGRAIRTDFA